MKQIIYALLILLLSGFLYENSEAVFAVENQSTSSLNAFEKLGVILTDDIASTYFIGDTILVRGRVTDGKKYALIYIENAQTGEEISELVRTDDTGNFQLPITLPSLIGKYYFIVASGNSFSSSLPQYLTLVDQKNNIPATQNTSQSIIPSIVYHAIMPYLFFGDDMWANMQIEQAGKTYFRSGKIISLNNLPLSIGNARITLEGKYLSTTSSLDQMLGLGFSWNKTVFIDRTRDVIGKDLVAMRSKNAIMIMDFIVKKGEQLYSDYYVTNPDGNVVKYKFDPMYIDNSGFLKTGVRIQQSFAIQNIGVSKIETVRTNGLAYFNLPISRNLFWSIIPPLSDSQISLLRSDKKLVDRNVLKNINTIRSKLRKLPIIIDPILSDLAQKKAMDMAEYNYVGHTTHNGMGILDFASFLGITLRGSIGENVAGGNISDLSLEDGLEESGSHRHAMVEDKYKKIGIGYVLKNGKTYLVQVFGE